MGRWEPNAHDRLAIAALDLFAERGYDSTTVAEIAERAGLTKRTFFRHFADKREVLFGGQEMLIRLLRDTIAGAPESASPLEAIGTALDEIGVFFGPERLEWSKRRQAVIDDHRELRERELLKSATLAATMAAALRERGVPELTAGLAAEVGNLAFHTGFTRWLAADGTREFPDAVRAALKELQAALPDI